MKRTDDYNAAATDQWAIGFGVMLVLMWILVLVLLFTPETANGHGIEHATIGTMDQGGDGRLRHDAVFVAAWLLGSVMIAMFSGLLAWGTVRPPRPEQSHVSGSGRLMWFLTGSLLFEVVFGMLCYAYWTSLDDPTAAFSGPFPPATSWMLFGVWLFPAFFVALYVVKFHCWILPPESEQQFADLVRTRAEIS